MNNPNKKRLRRTMMFLNAQKPGLIKDPYIYKADSLMLDLEDAVAENQKGVARFSLYHALKTVDYRGAERVVRINGLDTPYWREDIRACVAGGCDSIRIPKTEHAEDVRRVAAAIAEDEKTYGRPEGEVLIIAALESARGVMNALEICESDERLFGIALSGGDYTKDLQTHITGTGIELMGARQQMIIAARAAGVQCFDTFTGFKFMAEKKNALEASGEGKVVFSYEESYGYMLGDYVRDKDAVTASMLLTEMAAWYAAQGMTLFDALEKLYEKYGHYAEKTYNLVMPGLDGLKDMAQLMKNLRENPPAEISGVKVVTRKDYTDGSVVDCATGAKSAMELSGSNVLRFELADGTTILVRPSGTEPKIKVYILTQGADSAACDANLEKYGQWVKTLQK